ncbi:MAG: GAF domain-containing protein [Ignavibacteria bacterium]|nr:GAF domain-containing protein [Ignavibacteria bacterium]
MNNTQFPFKTSFSLDKLIDFWRKSAESSEECIGTEFARRLVHDIEQVPELNGSISDYSVLNKHKELVGALMSAIITPAYWNTNLTSVCLPLLSTSIYATPKFNELFVDENGNFTHNLNVSREYFDIGKIITVYATILKRVYNVDMTIIVPLIRTITDKDTGLERFYKMNLDDRFIDVNINGTLPEIKQEQITLLSENMFNIQLWNEIIPPELIEFTGFLVVNMFEVTDQEALSKLKFDLLDKNILTSPNGFSTLEKRIRTMFRNPELRLGIASFTDDKTTIMRSGTKIGESFILSESCAENCTDYDDSIYEKAVNSGEPQIIYDLNILPNCTKVEKEIRKMGIRNLMIAPLVFEGKTIGVMELGSPKAGSLNSINALKLIEILPLFSLALKRSLEDIENRIQAIIKEKCTAVHPAVEWRFRKAAMNLIEKESSDEFANMEDIIFKDVYPLYALSDIRNSSATRNKAIQKDLRDNLKLAKEIISAASSVKLMPEFEHIIYKIEKHIYLLEDGLQTGDEAAVQAFLKKEIEPLFDSIANLSSDTRSAIERYNNAVDKEIGLVYRKRKEYDHSVKTLNENIASIVDDEEAYAQTIFPHYFEKYKTDGVEYTMYIGDSISEKGSFHPVYLKNLRLWQFILMCRVAAMAEKVKPMLKIQLELAHLVLVQNTPLAIRFHHDQKKFDVDGTYNVHYEIMKKRIDKAEIRGKEERLTQPGKIAVVYSQQSEANEYVQYIEYLQAKGFLKKEVEHLELEDLQGVYGLRAIRVTVDLESKVYDSALKSDLNGKSDLNLKSDLNVKSDFNEFIKV